MTYHQYWRSSFLNPPLFRARIYIDLEQAIHTEIQNGQFSVKVATNSSEAYQLLESGFDHISKMHGHKLFRKRKARAYPKPFLEHTK